MEALPGCRIDDHPCALLRNLFDYFDELRLSEIALDRMTKIRIDTNCWQRHSIAFECCDVDKAIPRWVLTSTAHICGFNSAKPNTGSPQPDPLADHIEHRL